MLRGRRCEAHIATLQAEAVRAEGGSTWKEFVICVKLAKRNQYGRNPAQTGEEVGKWQSREQSAQQHALTSLLIYLHIPKRKKKKKLKSQQNSQITQTIFTATSFEFCQIFGYPNDCPQPGKKPNHFVLRDGKRGQGGKFYFKITKKTHPHPKSTVVGYNNPQVVLF